MEFFAHPWYMAFGGLLISSPILIHLINRMRFKRIRWAAMEFLLKAQKKNRRKMIVEQLILLLLRILLVLLAAFLVARFVYGGAGPRGATHLVVMDDSLSMNDASKDGAATATAYAVGIEHVKKLADKISRSSSAQFLQVYLLSEVEKAPLFSKRVSNTTSGEIASAFGVNGNKPTLLAGDPLLGLQKARKYFADQKADQSQRVLHFISDFRASDWSAGPKADKLADEVKGILADGINLDLVDAASPFRGTTGKVVRHSDNLAITDFKADLSVAIEDSPVVLTAVVRNFGVAPSLAKGQLKVSIDGIEALIHDQNLPSIAANGQAEIKFPITFPPRRGAREIDPKDSREERERKRRSERDFHSIRVTLPAEDAGLNADNVRDLVVEVRRRVPTLVVDGNNRPETKGEGGDRYHLSAFTAASGSYDLEDITLAGLEKADLDLYPCIIMLNVAEVPEPIVKRLKAYVDAGGSLCWFLGEQVKSDHYNTALYKAGLFPVLLTDKPFDPLASLNSVEEREKERAKLRSIDRRPKILFPLPGHAVTERLAKPAVRDIFRFLSVNVYWKAQPRSAWDPTGDKAQLLIRLPNSQDSGTYQGRATDLMSIAAAAVNKLSDGNVQMKPYGRLMDDYQRAVRNALSRKDLYGVAEILEDMRVNQGVKGDAAKPSMADLWNQPDLKAIGDEIAAFREQILYGDPLLVSRREGKGRVVAMLTTAGTARRQGAPPEDLVAWNDWGSQGLPSIFYPVFMGELYRYLISEGQAPNRLLGERVRFSVDAERYEPKVEWTFLPQPDVAQEKIKLEPEKDSAVMAKDGKVLAFDLPAAATKRPGVFRFTLTALGEAPVEDRQEARSFAYNVDALAESDLKRAATDRVEPEGKQVDPKAGKFSFGPPTGNVADYGEKKPDASESPWLYLFFILILVVEQAMAVHLSYHVKGNEANAPTGPAPQPA